VSLPLYDNANYRLTREAPEATGTFVRRENGRAVAGWELRVPPRGPDGFPYQIIFAGPTSENRGSAFRLRLVTRRGEEIPGDAGILLELIDASGENRVVIFQGQYQEFQAIPDQHAADAALAVQRRVQAPEGAVIRLSVTLPEGAPEPDLDADESFFEIEVYKHWMNFVA
jgi:hypothetical protein